MNEEIQPAAHDPLNGMITTLLKGRKMRYRGRQIPIDNLMAGYVAGRSLWKTSEMVRKKLRERRTYTITVPDTDRLFYGLQPWLLDSIPDKGQRSIQIELGSRMTTYDDDSPTPISSYRAEAPKRAELSIIYDGKQENLLVIEGHSVKVSLERNEEFSDGGDRMRRMPRKLTFTCTSIEARHAVHRMIQEVADQMVKEGETYSSLWIMDQWGNWERSGKLKERPLSSIVCTGNQTLDVAEDMERFLASGERYRKVSAPYHRGYLFYGPPGTGKSSLAIALGTHFKLDVHYLSLSSMASDTDFSRQVSGVRSGILLLEDIDIFNATRNRDQESERGVTLQGLLNTLDGV